MDLESRLESKLQPVLNVTLGQEKASRSGTSRQWFATGETQPGRQGRFFSVADHVASVMVPWRSEVNVHLIKWMIHQRLTQMHSLLWLRKGSLQI